MNYSAISLGLSCLFNPSQLRPSLVLQCFSQIPQDIPAALASHAIVDDCAKRRFSDIRALVLDKDNCFAEPHSLQVHASCQSRFSLLKEQYPGARLLIVSNTTGCLPSKRSGVNGPSNDLSQLQENLGGPHVLVHEQRKPGCGDEVMAYLREHAQVTHPSQVCVVGDRLFTDILMANRMGAHSIWLQRGVLVDTGAFTRFERLVFRFLQ
ncbi:mitochondrial PGP phosphatase [Protomyces lactucae-debilis]|uniref:Mitochondrial PGP phosphatase n=1 Tax=Protomyces lactucae-debilis TaxID=2754530 RepID=A0A1Y2FSG2_PROLT|nr:mitochondrial PGP phosphatase [Protomyces lactucae-debilis]ORY86126.1 mitochondrial PGP phosphatase [Protomyces lactucae-debilis]